MGLIEYGYYQCAVAAGIDRVMGFDLGLKSRYRQSLPGEVISKSWQKACETCKAKKPSLS